MRKEIQYLIAESLKVDKADRFDFIDGCLELHVEVDEVETQRQGWNRCQIGGELKGDAINFEGASNFLFFFKQFMFLSNFTCSPSGISSYCSLLTSVSFVRISVGGRADRSCSKSLVSFDSSI